MKSLKVIVLSSLIGLSVHAQDVKFPALDSSPADIAYYPLNTTRVKKGEEAKPIIKVLYARPSKKGREVFGTLVEFGKVNRIGANESNEIRFFKPVTIGGKALAAGAYSFFAIPAADKWTIIINKQTDRWGAYTYDETKDVVRVDVPVKPLENVVEALSITFKELTDGAALVIGWDKTSVELPITFKK